MRVLLFSVLVIVGLCYLIDLYWKIRGFFKKRNRYYNG